MPKRKKKPGMKVPGVASTEWLTHVDDPHFKISKSKPCGCKFVLDTSKCKQHKATK